MREKAQRRLVAVSDVKKKKRASLSYTTATVKGVQRNEYMARLDLF